MTLPKQSKTGSRGVLAITRGLSLNILQKLSLYITTKSSRKAPASVLMDVKLLLQDERTFDHRDRIIFWDAHAGKVKMMAELYENLIAANELESYFDGFIEMGPGKAEIEVAAFNRLYNEYSSLVEALSLLEPSQKGRGSPDCMRALILSRVKTYASEHSGVSFEAEWKSYVHACKALHLSLVETEVASTLLRPSS